MLSQFKKEYTHIKRIYCLSDVRHLRKIKRPKWLKDEDYEEFIYLDLSFDYWYNRIYFRNVEMVDKSDYIIFFVNQTKNSGAYKIFKYAKKQKKKYFNFGSLE